MYLRKITTGVFALATLLFVGCDDDDSTSVTKLDSGKWKPTSSESIISVVETESALGQTETTDTSYTRKETFKDTTELLSVSDESIIYYSDKGDSTLRVKLSNDFAGEMKKLLQEWADEMVKETKSEVVDIKVTKLELNDYTSSVSGDVLTLSYTGILENETTVSVFGLPVTTKTKTTTKITDKFEAYEGDIPPSSWPTKMVDGEFKDL